MILVTGAAGFIGMHVAERLLRSGHDVLGLDNLNDYYSVSLKRDRLAQLKQFSGFSFLEGDIAEHEMVVELLANRRPEFVVHLAAQAGVRYSLENPRSYLRSNVDGFLSILEAARRTRVRHLVYASSSSVYGGNTDLPFSEGQRVDTPVSLYAATKKANELMAHTYAHLYGIASTGCRFFTVYGPWGRPDMSPYLFADAISKGNQLKVFNHGDMIRDFTYVDDVVSAVISLMHLPPTSDAGPPHRVVNIGNSKPVQLLEYIREFESAFGREADKVMLPLQPGDVLRTEADTKLLESLIGEVPGTPLKDGVRRFVDWYQTYHAR
ncbi:NAD-dependent epimerase/dehydratase family protein [Ramlibacter sp. Leaf400]|uniref:NAD-dependent epimerase/dehydratase family protein n=1 Tax=Ramlibacter sp. Leaf400 TaxID=1736365 RepID=UPI00070231EF|nr:NAD-dependent epimerase/dehydratase family protein [Ramlibacter sp. Leaf400]KQT10830.1 protein CapI [Ramlibacter sp. Leaf400]